MDAEQLKAIRRFGLGPAVRLYRAGRAQLPSETNIADSALERRVREELPFLDLGLWREQILRVEGRVCRVEIDNRGVGTGFLVGPDTVLTNYHVLKSVIENSIPAEQVKLRFDFRVLSSGLRSQGTVVSLAPKDWLLDSSKYTVGEGQNLPDATLPTIDELDYALVRLSEPLGRQPLRAGAQDSSLRGWVEIPATAPAISTGMPILIVQHQMAGPMALALDTSGVQSVNANNTRVRYSTNTENGSSGSPCFDIHWGLVALHHYGDRLHDRAQYNQGIPMAAIHERLARQGKLEYLGGPAPM